MAETCNDLTVSLMTPVLFTVYWNRVTRPTFYHLFFFLEAALCETMDLSERTILEENWHTGVFYKKDQTLFCLPGCSSACNRHRLNQEGKISNVGNPFEIEQLLGQGGQSFIYNGRSCSKNIGLSFIYNYFYCFNPLDRGIDGFIDESLKYTIM